MTKILVVGGGAREHALTWALKQSPQQPRVYAAPGNPGMDGAWFGAREDLLAGAPPTVTRLPIQTNDLDALLAFAHAQAD